MEKVLAFIGKASIFLSVFLIPLVWSPWTFESFEFSKQHLLFSLVLVGLFAWFVKMVLVEGEIHWKKTPLALPIFLFVLAGVFSSIFSADIWSSLFGSYGRFGDGLLGTLSAIGLYFLVVNTTNNASFVLRPFFLACAFVVVAGYLSLFGVFWQPGFNTVAASQETFLVFLAFLASFLAFFAFHNNTRQVPKSGILALLFLALGLLYAIGSLKGFLILTLGLVAVLFLLLLEFARSKQKIGQGRLWFLAGLLLLSVLVLFSSAVRGGFVVKQADLAPSGKMSWGIAFRTLQENGKNLLLGSGLGTFALDFSKHKPPDINQTNQWQVRFARPGSYGAELLATTGIIGFLSYLTLLLWFFLVFWKEKKSLPFLLGAGVLFAAQLAHEQTVVLQVVFWLFLALAVVSLERPLKEFRFSFKRFAQFHVAAKTALVLFFFLIVYAFFLEARMYRGDIRYKASVQSARVNLAVNIQNAKEAVVLNPWQAEYKMFLAKLYGERFLRELQKPENSRDQEQILKDVRLAIAYARGDSVEGRRIIGATELSPKRVAVWETLGAVYASIAPAQGALDWGIHAFETAIPLEPANPMLHVELGKLYVAKKDLVQAREYFTRARELKPDFVDAHLQLALVEEKEGNIAQAIVQLQDVMLRFPGDMRALFQLGRLYYNKGEAARAIFQFELIVKEMPSDSNALFALGVAYESEGRIPEAIGAFEKVLRLNPGNVAVQKKLQELGQ